MGFRIKVSKKELDDIFREHKNLSNLGSVLGVHPRTLSDWRRGVFTIPEEYFDKILKICAVDKNGIKYRKLFPLWHIKAAAKKGAIRRAELYGDLGTPEGRKKGGINSAKKHAKNGNGFNTLLPIRIPKDLEKLAELMGVLIGDGHLSYYQVSITTNSKTDMEHAIFCKNLINQLFGINSKLFIKKGENAVNVVASSRNLVKFLNKKGMPFGNKIKNGVCIPKWIFRRNRFKRAFLRGLFDTDGCVYVDIHKNNGKIYEHFGWTITSYSPKLLSDTAVALKELGFSPTNRDTQKSVFLRRQEEISSYFKRVGTNNYKHHKRFYGRVPKRS